MLKILIPSRDKKPVSRQNQKNQEPGKSEEKLEEKVEIRNMLNLLSIQMYK